MEDKKQETKEGKSEETTKDNGDRHKSEADKEIDRINADTERINKAIADNENAKARASLGGVTSAGQEKEVKKEETPKEYHTRVKKEMSEGKTDFGN